MKTILIPCQSEDQLKHVQSFCDTYGYAFTVSEPQPEVQEKEVVPEKKGSEEPPKTTDPENPEKGVE